MWFAAVQTSLLDEVMMSAIRLNRAEFVDLFLDNGVSLKEFLTIGRLQKLYNDVCLFCLCPSVRCLLYTSDAADD